MDPSQWPAQAGHHSQAHQQQQQPPPQTFQPQASTSAQSLLSVYPFASTLPTGQIAQQVTSLARSATDVRPYPSVLYPQYYEQSGSSSGYTYPEHHRAAQVLQSAPSQLGQQERVYWESHQERALELLRQEEKASGYQRSQYQAPAQQPQQPSTSSFNYPTYQTNNFSSSLLQSFSYPAQATVGGTHPLHSARPQYYQYQMSTSQSQPQAQASPVAQQYPAGHPQRTTSLPQRTLSQSQSSPAMYQSQGQPLVPQHGQLQRSSSQSQSHSPAMYQQQGTAQAPQATQVQRSLSQSQSHSPAMYLSPAVAQTQARPQVQQAYAQPQVAYQQYSAQSPSISQPQASSQPPQQQPAYSYQQGSYAQTKPAYSQQQASQSQQQASYSQPPSSLAPKPQLYPQEQTGYQQQQSTAYPPQQPSYSQQQPASYQAQTSSNSQQRTYAQATTSYSTQAPSYSQNPVQSTQTTSYPQMQYSSSQFQQTSYPQQASQPQRTSSYPQQAQTQPQYPQPTQSYSQQTSPAYSANAPAPNQHPPTSNYQQTVPTNTTNVSQAPSSLQQTPTQPQWPQPVQSSLQGYGSIDAPVIRTHPLHRAYNSQLPSPSKATPQTNGPSAPFERLLQDTKLAMQTSSVLASSQMLQNAMAGPRPTALAEELNEASPLQTSPRAGRDRHSSSTIADGMPLKPRIVATAPGTDDDSPDPIVMGPYARRPTGISSQASPAHVNGLHAPMASSPLKRKASDGKNDVDFFGSPSKKRADTGVAVEMNGKPYPLGNPPVSPMRPLSQKPKSQSSPSKAIPYVLVPPLPEGHKRAAAPDSEEARGKSEEFESDDSLGTRIRRSGVKTAGKRTGERDDRADVKKLMDYLEDIFEAEDSLPAISRPPSPALVSTSPTINGQSSGFFSVSPESGNDPVLLPHVLRKLLRYIEASSVETRHHRRKGRRGALSQVDSAVLSRLLRILDRSVKSAVDLEPFPATFTSKSAKNTPKKSKKGRGKKLENGTPSKSARKTGDADRRSLSRAVSDTMSFGLDGEPEEDMDAAPDDESPEPEREEQKGEELTDATFERSAHMLEKMSLGILAADCCLALLTADTLPRQLYSEDIIKDCLHVAKASLEKVIYPVVEVAADGSSDNPLIKRVTASKESTSWQQLSTIFQTVLSLLPRIDALISHGEHAMSEEIVISATYIAIGPFFVVEHSSMGDDLKKTKTKSKDAAVFALGGKAGFPALRLSALSLVRSIFANHPDQRLSIIEEILTSLIKLPDVKRKGGQFRLRNGKSINIVSALLLQLVQTTGRDLRLNIKSVKAKTVTGAPANQLLKQEDAEVLDKETLTEVQMYKAGLEDAHTCAKTILQFLVNRLGKSKTTKDSNEAEYRAILDNFLADLLTVLYWPEWPAASLLLNLACVLMMQSLGDVKTTADNATKQMALDHLGTIAAHLRSVTLKARPEDPAGKPKYRSLFDIVQACSVNRFKNVLAAHSEIASYLGKRAADDHSEDQAYLMAEEFSITLWGHELATNLTQAVNDLEAGAAVSAERYEKGTSLVKEMSDALRNVWRKDTEDVFDTGSDSESSRIDTLCQLLGATNPLQDSFERTISIILSALASPAVFMRTKALRAIGQIVTCDSELLRQQNVRQTIESHLVDSSSAVREAAIELIGKYIVQGSEVAGEYYAKLAERMADTGLGVRKRVMKLLRSLYDATGDVSRKVDICIKMIQRLQDEDETVKDLAVKSMEEMWFPPAPTNGHTAAHMGDDRLRVFMEVVGAFKERLPMLEDLLRQILQDKNTKDDQVLIERYTALCDSLINCLIDGQAAELNLVHCVQGIYLLATAHPKVLSGSRAEHLLPYLKLATTPDERAVTESILKVFRAAIPGMPKTAVAFGEDLQKALLPMISKPSTVGGIGGLQETVACLCAVVKHLTHDYGRLVGLLKPCKTKLQVAIDALEKGSSNPALAQSTPLLMFIVAFMNEHCDFDEVRTRNPETAVQLDSMSTDSISEYFYTLFLRLYQSQRVEKISAAALQCLGVMFKAYPKLLTHDSTLTLMDAVFASADVEGRGRVLKILQDFLASEAAKRAEEERAYKKAGKKSEVDMDELIGSADNFADSGIASTIIQRYLGQILDGALSPHVPTQRFSVDILGYTIKQGLSHPLRCIPVLIALETSADVSLSARAGGLHGLLQNKHASMLNSRLIDCARKSFEYQTRISDGAPVRGFRGTQAPVALLHRWYTLVREKRGPRQDLLKAMMKAFDVDTTNLSSTDENIAFIRYMAENVSALEYKSLEEVLTVVRSLMSVLSVAGMQLVDNLARLDLGDQVDADTAEGVLITQAGLADAGRLTLADPFPLMRASVAVGIILVLKGYLKALYGLSEEKCMKFQIGKKSSLGDRPAVRKHDYPMDYERLPFAMSSLVTVDDLRDQRRQFLQLWAQDGVTVDPADDMDMDQPL